AAGQRGRWGAGAGWRWAWRCYGRSSCAVPTSRRGNCWSTGSENAGRRANEKKEKKPKDEPAFRTAAGVVRWTGRDMRDKRENPPFLPAIRSFRKEWTSP